MALVAGLPPAAWADVVEWLPKGAAALALRRTCKAMAEVVAQRCAGGAGRLEIGCADKRALLEGTATASLGRALLVEASLAQADAEQDRLDMIGVLAVAVDRGHMVALDALFREFEPTVLRAAEETLAQAARKGLLTSAHLCRGVADGWRREVIDAISETAAITLYEPERSSVPHSRRCPRISLWAAQWADMAILSGLEHVELHHCELLVDLAPLARVPTLTIKWCHELKALAPMFNARLELNGCSSLSDLSGLSGGRVGRIVLAHLFHVDDVSVLGALQPPPRAIELVDLGQLNDVGPLGVPGIHHIKLAFCRRLDECTANAALRGTVGTIEWMEAEEDRISSDDDDDGDAGLGGLFE